MKSLINLLFLAKNIKSFGVLRRIVPEGHDCCCQRHSGYGVEVGEMGKNKMNRGKDHDKIGELDVSFTLITANYIMKYH